MGLRHYFLFGIIVSTIGYFSYVEYPEPCDFPVLIKSYYSIIRLVTNLSYVWHCIGGSYVSLVRLVEFDFSPEVEGVNITKIVLGGVQTTIFNPLTGLDKDKDDAASAIIYFHGGGFAVGSVGLYSSFVKTLSKNSGMVIIFLEYRLAPEHPYPIGLQDCITATLDFVNQAEKFNVDRNKIVFMGDSAGGNLAMAVSLNLAKRDKEYFKPCHMTIVYPLLQMSNFKLPSYKKNANAPLVSPEQTVRYVLLYMGIRNFTDLVQPMVHNMHIKGLNTDGFAEKITESLVPQKYKTHIPEVPSYWPSSSELQKLEQYKATLLKYIIDPYFAPLSAKDEDLKLLSKTHIVTSEFDVLRDEGLILYERMKSLGLDVTYTNLEYAAHGIFNMYGTAAYDKYEKSVEEMIEEIKYAVENC